MKYYVDAPPFPEAETEAENILSDISRKLPIWLRPEMKFWYIRAFTGNM